MRYISMFGAQDYRRMGTHSASDSSQPQCGTIGGAAWKLWWATQLFLKSIKIYTRTKRSRTNSYMKAKRSSACSGMKQVLGSSCEARDLQHARSGTCTQQLS